MNMREIVSGGAEACRQKALSHIKRIKQNFTDTTTDEEKFDAFLKAFDKAAYGTERCRENFAGENYLRWANDRDTAAKLKEGEEVGVILLDLLHAEMQPLLSSKENQPLSQVNGTSVKFAECAQKRDAAIQNFIRTEVVFAEKILQKEAPPTLKQMLANLEAKVASYLAPLLLLPENLWY
jgi:hypothetical protein